METDLRLGPLTMVEALVEWCDPHLVEAVRIEERRYTATELAIWPEPKLSPQDQWRRPTGQNWMIGETRYSLLRLAWQTLVQDFRNRIEAGAMYLEGVEVTDEYDAEAQALRGAFAAEFKFAFSLNTLRLGKKRYAAITVSRAPSLWADIEASGKGAAKKPTPEQIPHFTDKFILSLLEEHAKRVVESDQPNMFPPGKISLIPIVRRKMEFRAKQNQLASTHTAEAAVLASWIKSALPSHHTPAAGTIRKVTVTLYEELVARSKRAIK